jgi:heat shock protein HslJ
VKKIGIIFVSAVLGAIIFASCASGKPAAQDTAQKTEVFVGPADFSEVLGSSWELMEVKLASGAVVIDRQKTPDVYTVNFADGKVSGKAAPNSYNGHYTLGVSNNIAFGQMVSTKMALLEEPEGLKEQEYFNYLAKVKSWEVSNGQLFLYTEDDAGGDVSLVYNAVSQ